MLRANSTLEQLRLRRNRITDVGAIALAEASRERFLRMRAWQPAFRYELDLESNRIKAKGAASLLMSLTAAPEKANIELLVHGNSVAREDLAAALPPPPNDDQSAPIDVNDSRLWFA